ncbi:NgoMIV restriction enzyme [Thermomonospora echinospora]|uniref:NgoMIV restriction enzyme n=1 Tax=Thermomonospora echinospora TaxID=1992 RepID=A0A1H6E8S2_9ACTN|nr:NgoMIV family type II restriction endonuclease [Thermomonospora echinospora]SEG94112.1 NgoMIV restriction enzyme [Thermomonospora echinospora]
MTAAFAPELLGWRRPRGGKRPVPNCADSDSAQSVILAEGMLRELGLVPNDDRKVPTDPGPVLEEHVRRHLTEALPHLNSHRAWQVRRGTLITDFAQYAHLRRVDELVRDSAELRITIGQDYLIKPDVTVGIVDLAVLGSEPFLHGAVSCKWTIRSDRVQNIRHECNQMIRHRRGRQPHLVTVTAEPLPSRLASIARGTGEVDAVYHIAFDALDASVRVHGNSAQKDAWEECVEQRRLLSYKELPETLAQW